MQSLSTEPSQPVSSEPFYFTAEQVRQIIMAAPAGPRRLLILWLWRTGMRISETLAVSGKDIRAEEGRLQVLVSNPKGGPSRWRIVPLHRELAAALGAVALRPTGKLFKFSASTAQRAVHLAIAESGATPRGQAKRKTASAHSLRHSAARHWLAQGVPVNQVSQWLGHRNPQVTLAIYERLAADDAGVMDTVE